MSKIISPYHLFRMWMCMKKDQIKKYRISEYDFNISALYPLMKPGRGSVVMVPVFPKPVRVLGTHKFYNTATRPRSSES